jgi:hypothetical protein
MPAVLIILAVLIVVALYFDPGETHGDTKESNRSNIVDPRR